MKLEKEHFIWIIEEGARLDSPVAIKRAFVRRFKMSPRAAKNLRPQKLMEVLTSFRKKLDPFLLRKDPRPVRRGLEPRRMWQK